MLPLRLARKPLPQLPLQVNAGSYIRECRLGLSLSYLHVHNSLPFFLLIDGFSFTVLNHSPPPSVIRLFINRIVFNLFNYNTATPTYVISQQPTGFYLFIVTMGGWGEDKERAWKRTPIRPSRSSGVMKSYDISLYMYQHRSPQSCAFILHIYYFFFVSNPF